MTEEVHCPRCDKDVEVNAPWGELKCPECGLEGYWDEMCTEDLSDCWPVTEWNTFEFVTVKRA